MRGLDLIVEWRTPPSEGEAFGPERFTWGNLTILLDGRCLSKNHPADGKVREDREYLTGGMSGLAEWLVECWPYLLWEIHTPFARASACPERTSRQTIPGLRHALQGWTGFIPDEVERGQIASWQHRHTLGHASADIALASIVLLPEERHLLISVDHPPTHLLDSTVRFTPPDAPHDWPSEQTWVAREDFVASASAFIEETIARAKQFEEVADWAQWLSEQWGEASTSAKDPFRRRRLMFGESVARRWDDIERALGQKTHALFGLLMDTPIPESDKPLDKFIELLSASPPPAKARGLQLCLERRRTALGPEPWRQGYAAAEWLRRELDLGEDPISDLRSVLEVIDIRVEDVETQGAYRSAVSLGVGECARIFFAKDDPRYRGVAPTRFSIAAALGRLVCDEELVPGSWFGAAQGEQSRLRHSQRANAFAAEFLLPGAVASRSTSLDEVCDDYGISHAAAEWHRKNRQM